MAVSKRLRYEILRRDNHTCRYCGASAPAVPLRVDHVTPVALGGSDKPENLVTSCEPCNSGKSSATVDSAVVADVDATALRWANAMEQAADNLRQQETPKVEYRDAFLAEWNRWHVGKDKTKKIPLPDDWKQTMDRFRVAGIPAWMWADIVDIGMGNDKVKPDNTFRYCCGIAWNKVTELQSEARQIASAQQPSRPTREATVVAVTEAWAGSYQDRFGVEPTEDMLEPVRDLAAAGFDLGTDPEGMLNAAIAGAACGEPYFGIFFREDPEFLAAVEEASQVWQTNWAKTDGGPPDAFDIGCFRASVGQALGMDYTQYQIVQQSARTGATRGIDLVHDLTSANVPAGGEH